MGIFKCSQKLHTRAYFRFRDDYPFLFSGSGLICMDKQTPRVSIVTPSYNQAQFLEQTISSVLSQDYPNIEYIVIDGESTDNSISIIQQHSDGISYWVSESDKGQTNAINKGLLKATGDILGWLNSDDTLTDGAVSRIVKFFQTKPDVDLIYGPINRIDEGGNNLDAKNVSKRPFSPETMIGDREVNQPGSFWTRAIMEKIGLLDENYQSVMDYEYWTRILLAGGKIARLEGEPVANFRLSPKTKTKSLAHQSGLEELKLIDRLIQDPRLYSLDVNPSVLEHQIRKARSNACLKIFKSYLLQTEKKRQAFKWLRSALYHNPLALVTRLRFLFSVLRDYVMQEIVAR
jgi:glycosyltransferase involved in cell wall biosynthesis